MIFWYLLQFKNFPRFDLSMRFFWNSNFNTRFYGGDNYRRAPYKDFFFFNTMELSWMHQDMRYVQRMRGWRWWPLSCRWTRGHGTDRQTVQGCRTPHLVNLTSLACTGYEGKNMFRVLWYLGNWRKSWSHATCSQNLFNNHFLKHQVAVIEPHTLDIVTTRILIVTSVGFRGNKSCCEWIRRAPFVHLWSKGGYRKLNILCHHFLGIFCLI